MTRRHVDAHKLQTWAHLHTVCSCITWFVHITFHMAQARSHLPSTVIPSMDMRKRSLSVFSSSLYTSCRSSTSSSLSSWPTVTPWQSTTCATPRTGPSSPWTITSPSQVMSPTPWISLDTTELNDAISSDFIDFQDSLAYTVPSSDHYMDDDTLGKFLAEVHRDYADYRRLEGVRVSPSCVSVHGRSNGGNLWKRWLLRSVKAPVRSLGLCSINKDERSSQKVVRKFLITNSKQLKQNKNAKFYKKNYGISNRIFVKFYQQNLTEMEELRKFQSSTYDTLTRQKFIEDSEDHYGIVWKTKMKSIVCLILRIFRMLNQYAVEIRQPGVFPNRPLFQGILRPSYRSDKLKGCQIFGIHPVYQEKFLHIHKLPRQLRILKNWILLGGKTIEEPIHMSTSGEKWKTRTRSRSEMPVWTVSQRFSHLQLRRLFKDLWSRPTTTADFWSPLRHQPSLVGR